MGLLEYKAMPSLRDGALDGWLCTFTIQQQLEIPSACSLAAPVRATGTVRPFTYKITPDWSLFSSQPGRPPCWASPHIICSIYWTLHPSDSAGYPYTFLASPMSWSSLVPCCRFVLTSIKITIYGILFHWKNPRIHLSYCLHFITAVYGVFLGSFLKLYAFLSAVFSTGRVGNNNSVWCFPPLKRNFFAYPSLSKWKLSLPIICRDENSPWSL
jgi:hypothetical protein